MRARWYLCALSFSSACPGTLPLSLPRDLMLRADVLTYRCSTKLKARWMALFFWLFLLLSALAVSVCDAALTGPHVCS